jgi:hypothetical protein
VTLVEVLVAIFVMALGLLTLLALFPLGVLTMAQAIQDDRCATASSNATSAAIVQDLRHDANVTPYFLNPDPANQLQPPVFAPAAPDGPSYPVYVDPMGYYSYTGAQITWVGGQPPNSIPRVEPAYVGNIVAVMPGMSKSLVALKWFSLLDDIQFDVDGMPNVVVAPNTFQRDNLYTWAYLLRRPLQGDPTVVEMSVIAYNKRTLALNQQFQGDENAFAAQFDPTSNIVTISWNPAQGQAAPNLRVGSWILDTTPVASATVPGMLSQLQHAYFYRVVGITDTSATTMDVEVQSLLRGFPLPPPTPQAQQFSGTIVIMDGVAEVFEKGTGWHP